MQYLSDGDVTFGKFGKLLNEFPGIGSATNSYKKKSFVYKFKCTPTHTHNDESELSWGPFSDFKYSFYFRNWRTYWVCFSLLLVVFYSICIRPKFNFGLCQWFNLKQILNECLIHISRCKTSSWSEIELFTECTNFSTRECKWNALGIRTLGMAQRNPLS